MSDSRASAATPDPVTGRVRRRLGLGFGLLLALIAATGAVALAAIDGVVSREDQAAFDLAEALSRAERLRYHAEFMVAASRGFLLTRHPVFEQRFQEARRRFREEAAALRRQCPPAGAALFESMRAAGETYASLAAEAARRQTTGDAAPRLLAYFERVVSPSRELFRVKIDDFTREMRATFQQASDHLRADVRRSGWVIGLVTGVALAIGVALGWAVTAKLLDQFRIVQAAEASAHREADARAEMIAIASHDLRAPLNVILASNRFLLKDLAPDGGATRRLAEASGRAATSMLRLIEDVLESSRLDSGTLTLRPEDCSAVTIAREAAGVAEAAAAPKGIRLVLRVPPNDVPIEADRDRLVRVLTNLLVNAVKFSPEGSTVTLAVEADDQTIRVAISDQGPGIPPDHLPRIFERHWQARRLGEGLGLGLYIAKTIVELHGGSLTVSSRPAEGSTFTVMLPRRSPAPGTPPPAGPPVARSVTPGGADGRASETPDT